MWERGEKLPSQRPNTMICCLCGRTFDSHRLETLIHVPRITVANDPMKFGADPPSLIPEPRRSFGCINMSRKEST